MIWLPPYPVVGSPKRAISTKPRTPQFLPPKQPFVFLGSLSLFPFPRKFEHKLVLGWFGLIRASCPSLSNLCVLVLFLQYSHFSLLLRREMTGPEEAESVTLDLLKKKMVEFAKERDWEQFHSPRNLLLALVCKKTQSSPFAFL